MKKSVILSVILLCAGIASVSAQKKEWTPAPLRHWSLSVGASTAGAEIELATTLGHHFQLRAGVSALPYSLTVPYEMDFASAFEDVDERILAYAGVDPQSIPNEVDITARLDMMNYKVLMNIYPFKKSGLHLTAGFYYGNDKLVTASTQMPKEFMDAANQVIEAEDKFKDELDVIFTDEYRSFLEVAPEGSIDLYIKTPKKLKPYVGFGFGRAVPKGRLGLNMDFGVMFHGTPEIGSSNPELAKEINRMLAEEELTETFNQLNIYPVLSIRLIGRIF